MCSAGIKKYFLSSYFVGVYFYKRTVCFMKLYIVENPLAKLPGKSSFYKVLSDIYRHMCIFIFVRHLLLRKRYIVRH